MSFPLVKTDQITSHTLGVLTQDFMICLNNGEFFSLADLLLTRTAICTAKHLASAC